jgi:cell division protein FtsN
MAKEGGGGSQKSKVVAGLIIGMVLGVAVAGFVAWYVVEKNPASFSNRELREPKAVPPAVVPAPASVPVAAAPVAPAASAVVETQRYEFYKVLPDKAEGGTAHRQPAAQPAPKQAVSQPAAKPAVSQPATKPADSTPFLVQAGAFQNVDDAEKLKAKLALAGMEASVQKADVPGKGVWYRVRLGPYNGQAEANAAIASLKQNGVSNATALHAQ